MSTGWSVWTETLPGCEPARADWVRQGGAVVIVPRDRAEAFAAIANRLIGRGWKFEAREAPKGCA